LTIQNLADVKKAIQEHPCPQSDKECHAIELTTFALEVLSTLLQKSFVPWVD